MNEEFSFMKLPEKIDFSEHIIGVYYLETSLSMEKAAESLAGEQSTGTWTKVYTETPEIHEEHGAKIVGYYELPSSDANIRRGIVILAHPTINFGPQIPLMLSVVAGNLYEMKDFHSIKLLDLHFPREFVKDFQGPKFGVRGTREVLGVFDRPLVGTIIKPKAGMRPKALADLCYHIARGGLDFIKDDEVYGPVKYAPLEERVPLVMEAVDKANSEKNEKTLYAVNITDEVDKILENHDQVIKLGANCVMLNFVTAGFSALRVLAKHTKAPIHAHRDMFAAFTRVPTHGISTAVVTKLARLAGADQLHIGAIQGKLYEPDEIVIASARTCLKEFHNITPCLPVSSGGQHAGKIAINCKLLGKDALILAGGGVLGHPKSIEAGALSMRQALEAYMKKIPAREYAEDKPELKIALQTWGEVPVTF